MAKPKIFVSHSTKDNAFATRLVNDLNAAGAQAWMDVNDLGAGNFQQHISQALANCEWFLLVLTRNALASDWVAQEVDAANRLKHQRRIKELIFIKAARLDLSELPALWGVFNVFDATTDYSAALTRVLRAIGIVAQQTAAPESRPMGSIPPIRQGSRLPPVTRFTDATHTSFICPLCGATTPFVRDPKRPVRRVTCTNCGEQSMILRVVRGRG